LPVTSGECSEAYEAPLTARREVMDPRSPACRQTGRAVPAEPSAVTA